MKCFPFIIDDQSVVEPFVEHVLLVLRRQLHIQEAERLLRRRVVELQKRLLVIHRRDFFYERL